MLYFWLFASLTQKFISGSVGMLIREMECLVTENAKIYFLFSSDKFINYSIEEGGKNMLPRFFVCLFFGARNKHGFIHRVFLNSSKYKYE